MGSSWTVKTICWRLANSFTLTPTLPCFRVEKLHSLKILFPILYSRNESWWNWQRWTNTYSMSRHRQVTTDEVAMKLNIFFHLAIFETHSAMCSFMCLILMKIFSPLLESNLEHQNQILRNIFHWSVNFPFVTWCTQFIKSVKSRESETEKKDVLIINNIWWPRKFKRFDALKTGLISPSTPHERVSDDEIQCKNRKLSHAGEPARMHEKKITEWNSHVDENTEGVKTCKKHSAVCARIQIENSKWKIH